MKESRLFALGPRHALDRRGVDFTHRQLSVHPACSSARAKPLRSRGQIEARTALPRPRHGGLHHHLDHLINAVKATRDGEGHLTLLERLTLHLRQSRHDSGKSEGRQFIPLAQAALSGERTEHEQIVEAVAAYLTHERGLAASTVESHKLLSHRFLLVVCPAGAEGIAALTPKIIIGYVERHALDGSADSGKAMRGVVRAYARYLHLKGFISAPTPLTATGRAASS